MKIVLNTNVILSGLLFPGGPPDKLVRAVLTGQISNATSPDLLGELRRILLVKFKVPEERADALIELISGNSELVYPLERVERISADPADNRVLECAATADAEGIVTGDKKHLLRLRSFLGIVLLSPAAFLQKFERILF